MWSGQKLFSRMPAFSASSLDTESRAACVPKRFDLTKRPEDTRIFFSLQYFSMSVGEHSGAIQWIPFLMFETLNSCRRKLVCAKIMPNVGKNLSWCALLPNFKKNQKRKLVSSQIRLDHFPICGGNFGVLQRHKSTVYSRSFDMSRSTDGVQ